MVNRLARTRDAKYWNEQMREMHPDLVLDPPVQMRAAVAEAAAQSLPVHALRGRDGAIMAAGDFNDLLRSLDGASAAEPAAPHVSVRVVHGEGVGTPDDGLVNQPPAEPLAGAV